MTNASAIATRKGRDSHGRRSGVILSLAAILFAVGTTFGHGAYAQGAVPAAGEPNTAAASKKVTDAELLSDFLHYTQIASIDLAVAKGQELLSHNLKNADFVKLVEAGGTDSVNKFNQGVQRAMQNAQLQPVASKLASAYESGMLERARDRDQITKNIQDLLGNFRTKAIARERLHAAGEYAMPQLLEAFLDRSKAALSAEVQRVMVEMGRQSIIPLATAMMSLPPAQQEQVADVLGLIPYRTSLPFLADVAATSKVDAVRQAATRAIGRLGGAGGDSAQLYRSLAEAYYNEKSELTSFPGEDIQLLWSFDARAGGLLMTAIRTPVFHEAMAMRLLERGMQIEQGTGGVNPETLALWVAANFSREIDTPPGYVNPAYPVAGAAMPGMDAKRSAMYFAVATGAEVNQRVLARAVDAKDTPLARRALAAAEQTASGRNLWGNGGGRMPLLEALNYPNRRVQYEAALALAAAQPQNAFAGSDRVVPTLASSIRGASMQYAAVVTSDAEVYQSMRKALAAMGYTVLPQGRELGDLAQPIAEAPAVDLVVGVNQTGEKIPMLVEQVRNWTKISATPVLVVTNPDSYITYRRRYDNDSSVAIRQTGISGEGLSKSISDLVNTASGGPITEKEAHEYAQRSLNALRDLAVSNNPVFNVGDAVLPLIGALGDSGSTLRMQVAEILSRVNQERAQRAVMDAALTAKGPERVQLLGMVSESAKRYGNLLEVREVAQLIEIASKGADDEATAAASLMGALNLPNNETVSLIIK